MLLPDRRQRARAVGLRDRLAGCGERVRKDRRLGDRAAGRGGDRRRDEAHLPEPQSHRKTVMLSRVAVVSVANLKVSPFQERNHVHDYVRAVSASTGLE